ncbi:uncharacterized protein TNCV_953861 [Trichonephila clavipes]|nr:uncharacterized protein TNCV_953861 [Trichonephila clavipes]
MLLPFFGLPDPQICLQSSISGIIWDTLTLTAVPLGLGSNPGEDMDVSKCIVSSWHGVTLNSRRATNPFVRFVEGEERWKAPDHPQDVLPQSWDKTELNHSVICIVRKATANDRCHLALCHDEFRWPVSGL